MPANRSLVPRFVHVVLGLAWMVSSCPAQQLLQWKFQPGQVILVELEQSTRTQQASLAPGLKDRSENPNSHSGNASRSSTLSSSNPGPHTGATSEAKMTMRMKWQVRSISPEGVAEIAQTVENVAIDMSSPDGGRIQFDTSDQRSNTGLARTLRENVQPVIGLTVLQRMNPQGEILDARLAPESRQRLDNDGKGQGVRQVFSEEDVRNLVTQSAAVLPQRPVRPGDTWESSSKSNSPLGELLTTMRYTYRGSFRQGERTLERIDVQLDIVMPQKEQPPIAATLRDQQSQGTLWFDAQAGMFVQSSLQQGMTLQTNLGQMVQEHKLNTDMQIRFRPQTSLAEGSSTLTPR
jgi:hypothetical protein